MTDIRTRLIKLIARETYRSLYPGSIGTPDGQRTPESDLAEQDRAYQKWDDGNAGYAPDLVCRDIATHLADALLAADDLAVVELPKADKDEDGDPVWRAGVDCVFPMEAYRGYPMVMSDSDSGEAQTVFTGHPKDLAAALLAAAKAAEGES